MPFFIKYVCGCLDHARDSDPMSLRIPATFIVESRTRVSGIDDRASDAKEPD